MITLKFVTHDYLKMTERGEPKNLADYVEDIKRIKNITVLMDVLAGNVDSCEKAALMYEKLGKELSKIKRKLNKEKIIQRIEEKDCA